MSENEPRPLTVEEMRAEFLDALEALVHHIADPNPNTPVAEKLDTMVYAILRIFDGADDCLPAFKLIPQPHPDDEEDDRSEGENWWPDDMDIAGGLHGQWAMARQAAGGEEGRG